MAYKGLSGACREPEARCELIYLLLEQIADALLGRKAKDRRVGVLLSSAIFIAEGICLTYRIGCGPGASLFPLMRMNESPNLSIAALDYSKVAIDLVKSNPSYDPECMQAAVWDVADPEGIPSIIEPNSMDVVNVVYVLSALQPHQWTQAVINIAKVG